MFLECSLDRVVITLRIFIPCQSSLTFCAIQPRGMRWVSGKDPVWKNAYSCFSRQRPANWNWHKYLDNSVVFMRIVKPFSFESVVHWNQCQNFECSKFKHYLYWFKTYSCVICFESMNHWPMVHTGPRAPLAPSPWPSSSLRHASTLTPAPPDPLTDRYGGGWGRSNLLWL